jgi:surface carbohydrate biosynthesis protein
MFKFNCQKPHKTDVVLLYPEREDMIREYILKEIPYQVLDVGNFLSANMTVLARTLRLLPTIDFVSIFSSKRVFNSFLKRIYELHLQVCIEIIAPKVVLTFIDDSGVFHRLSRKCQNVKFFAIQNGLKLDFAFNSLPPVGPLEPKISMPNYFCFGESDSNRFSSKGCVIDNFFPIGSLVGGIYWGDISKETEPTYDICYISSWVGSPKPEVKEAHQFALWHADVEGSSILEENLQKLISDKGFSVIIALKYENSLEEQSYFDKIFGDSVHYQYASRPDFSTYRAIDKSRLCLSGYSTCSAEALGIGRRALFVNSTGFSGSRVNEAGISYLEDSRYSEFSDRIESILEMTEQEYIKVMSQSAKYMMNYDLEEMPHQTIRRVVLDVINNNGDSY